MSDEMQGGTSRRNLLTAIAGAITVAAAGGVAYLGGLFGPSYPRTPYDDLLALLPDRARARTIGKAVLAGHRGFDAELAATHLRGKIGHRPLEAVLNSDIASNDLYEVKGWVLPTTLTQLCALAAKVPV